MTANEYVRPFYSFLFLAGGGAPATWAQRVWRAASGIVAETLRASLARRSRPAPFPTDNRIREDIGLPLLAADPSIPTRRLTPLASTSFPTDPALRDDVGLPPLDNGSGISS
jgi:hypothetical protein